MASKFNDSLPDGAQILWYEIVKVLGKGGFGITYLAKDTNLDQLVAIKEYLPSAFASRDQSESVQPNSPEAEETFRWGLDRFLGEARTLARFRHPHIVRVLSFFENNNTAYMVMEFAEGKGLDAILKQRKTLTENQLRQLLLPLLSALETLHETGFIHRDLKPANILIRRDGKPVILDFGSARQALGQTDQHMTSLLTLGYSPFEQYDSSGSRQGPWTDIYAMGAVLYHAVTGKKPMDAALRINAKLRNQPDPMIRAVDVAKDRYNPAFLENIDLALQVLETDRPQSVSEWKAKLFEGQTLPASPAPRTAATASSPAKAQPQTQSPAMALPSATQPTATAKVSAPPAQIEPSRVVAPAGQPLSPPAVDSPQVELAAPQESLPPAAQAAIPPAQDAAQDAGSGSDAVPPKKAKKKNAWRSFVASINEFGTLSNNSGVAPTHAAEGKAAAVTTPEPKPAAFVVPQAREPLPSHPQPGTVWQEPITELNFVWIPSGLFQMGSNKGVLGWRSDESPVHAVELDGFWIAQHAVTWAAWNKVHHADVGKQRKNMDDGLPASGIGWEDAQSFLRNFTRMSGSGLNMGLPTEAQWEYAARAGCDSQFHFGDDMSELHNYAWYNQNSGDVPHPVGMLQANAWGLYDMLGNTWEWVEDWYGDDIYKKGAHGVRNPIGAPFGEFRICRGGSWRSTVKACRVAYRNRVSPTSKSSTLGFRLVLRPNAS
ncbi:serine/threonine protein kinase [Magnetococcus marinus MC-1]|uniref:Serine/threonine protein kinase n=1 Tax=Magnetococcus marinus (strain ATCC BAA-1437 / JCM 17883 / MC-1) TaxID=156889 RepID=A0L8Y6_MAGMM|nr:bifunctional serine/threonine-protein kinase/formylglycine-generating enzyme family protein [Magnetococcus marinus]ABK44429.1 serine/threonine protein kinase [Magnetococcus marinus MC-1]